MNQNNGVYNPFNDIDQQEINHQVKTKQISLSIIGIAILIIGLVGVTYAFFNYTRTGVVNTIRVGNIAFSSTQGTTINLNNVFPIGRDEIETKQDYVGSVTINVNGSTSYTKGVEYLISIDDIENTVGVGVEEKKVPISVDVDYSANGNGKTIGTENENYFNEGVRGGDTSYYKMLATNTIGNSSYNLVVGYIAPGETGIDGNIVVNAFLDKENIAISDTFSREKQYVVNSNLTQQQISECVEYLDNWVSYYSLSAVTDYCAGTGTIDGWTLERTIREGSLSYSENINFFLSKGIISPSGEYGTTVEWKEYRTIFTTNEWNSLQENGISFKIKVEANEGIWVDEPGKISTCPGCKYVYYDYYDIGHNYDNGYIYSTQNEYEYAATVINDELTDNYLDIVGNLNKKIFLGVLLNDNYEVTNIYVCGVKNEEPFCLEHSPDNSTFNTNLEIVQSEKLWNGTCTSYIENQGTEDEYLYYNCPENNYSDLYAFLYESYDTIHVDYDWTSSTSVNGCSAFNGIAYCWENYYPE